jgi:hypothetical protein
MVRRPQIRNGQSSNPDTPKRIAAMSKGVSGLRPPYRETILKPHQTSIAIVAAAKPRTILPRSFAAWSAAEVFSRSIIVGKIVKSYS